MLAIGVGKAIKLLDVTSGAELDTLIGHENTVQSVAFSPDGILASGAIEAKLWDVVTRKELRTLKHDNWVNGLAFSPDGKVLAMACSDKIRLWDAASGRELRTITGHTANVECVAFSPDGQLLASASDDLTIRLWEVAGGRELHALKGHTERVTSVAFSPRGSMLASASFDGTARIWGVGSGTAATASTRTPAPAAALPTRVPLAASAISIGNAGRVKQMALWDKGFATQVAWSPDGKLAIASSGIRFLDPRTMQEVSSIDYRAYIKRMGFSPDGALLAATSHEAVKLWEVASGGEVRDIAGLRSADGLAFSPEGGCKPVFRKT
jgi:WD40 repeat protein